MKFHRIVVLDGNHSKKGDLFCRLMSDLFHSLGYDEPRFDIQKSGREIDLETVHRVEKRIAIAECKAHKATIGGADINKFVGAFDVEKRKLKGNDKAVDVVGYFVSLSGFKETAIEQEREAGNNRVNLISPEQIVAELVNGRVIIPLEQAISKVLIQDVKLVGKADLIACRRGWIWAIYYSCNQKKSHVAFVHAEGELLVEDLANEIVELDKKVDNIFEGLEIICGENELEQEEATREKYFQYIKNECGEIHFEGLPTDKDSGAIKVKLENIFITPSLEMLTSSKNVFDQPTGDRVEIGQALKMKSRLAILAKPGGGKSTLIKRLATAYAFPHRKKLIDDNLPDQNWFPIFIRCRELGDKVSLSITEIIHEIPNRAEISDCKNYFAKMVSGALQKGKAILLIDGLDEISNDRERVMFVNQLRTFIATYPSIHLVLTSREAGFRSVGGILAHYCANFKIAPLNVHEIKSLCDKWHSEIIDNSKKTKQEALALSDLIIADYRIKTLAENPLLLTTLLFVKRWAGYLPTKKSVLYQEMIKLLMVTWNVEGHEQLDIEEAEPQLAFVAFWMMSNGKQTISLSELKECLRLARRQMPDILSYTNVSVSDFIKRVESRSSLLIMSGHKKDETGEIVPIYEFLHLSFQEFLTARAIVEKFLPEKDVSKTVVEVLNPFLERESWKEVIPLVAVLLKRDAKSLIDHLIELSIIGDDDDFQLEKVEKELVLPAEHLGSCLANEIQIAPDLLDKAIEWYAKNRYRVRDKGTRGTIYDSKFKDAFKQKIQKLYFDEPENRFEIPLGGLIGEIHNYENKKEDFLALIVKELESMNEKKEVIALFGLMIFCFENRVHSNLGHSKTKLTNYCRKIEEKLIDVVATNNKKLLLPAFWSMCWFGDQFILTGNARLLLVDRVLKFWLSNSNKSELLRVCTWALVSTLRPSLDLAKLNVENTKVESIAMQRFENPQNRYDKIAVVLLSNHHYRISISQKEKEKLIRDYVGSSGARDSVNKYAKKMGVIRSE